MGELPVFDMYMGDDGIIFTNKHPSLESIADVALTAFGSILNVDKSYATSNPCNISFLGYFNEYGFPVRSQDFLLASWIFPERCGEPDPVFTATRAVGQLWSTMNPGLAVSWYNAINDIVQQYDLQPNWLEDHLAMYPTRLKFLNLHGIRQTDIYLPHLDGRSLIPDVTPRLRPRKRTPGKRHTNITELFLAAIERVSIRDLPSDSSPS